MADPVGTPMEEQMARLGKDQQDTLKKMGVGAPGSPTLKPVTDLGNETKMPFTRPPPKPDEFPALERDVVAGVMRTRGNVELDNFEVLKTDTGGSGFAFEKDYAPIIKDVNKITPNVKLQQVIDFNLPHVKEAWMRKTS